MSQTNESKLKRSLTRLFKMIEQGESFTISFQGDKEILIKNQ